MTDSPAFIHLRAIILERVGNLITMHGAHNEARVSRLHLTLQAYLNADLSLPIFEEVVELVDDLRRIKDDDADLIDATPRSSYWPEAKAQALADTEDCIDAKIRELITDTVLAEYVAREIAA